MKEKHTKNKVRFEMSSVSRNSVFRASDHVLHKPCCTATDDGQRLENFGLKKKKRKLFIYVAKMICAFVFAYAKSNVFHYAAQIICSLCNTPLSNNGQSSILGIRFGQFEGNCKIISNAYPK